MNREEYRELCRRDAAKLAAIMPGWGFTVPSDEGRKCNRTACGDTGTANYGELWLCATHRREYPTAGLTGRGER